MYGFFNLILNIRIRITEETIKEIGSVPSYHKIMPSLFLLKNKAKLFIIAVFEIIKVNVPLDCRLFQNPGLS